MTRVAFAIQHHPARAALLPGLLEALEGPVLVMSDPEPTGQPNPSRTYLHALRSFPDDSTHMVVLQDDVEVCSGFRAAASAATAAQPERVLVYFVGGRPVQAAHALYRASDAGKPFASIANHQWCPAVAVGWPRALAEAFLRYVDSQRWPVGFRADDEMIGRFLRTRGETALATVPSLVEHPDMEPSLIGLRTRYGRDLGRVAACYIGDCDPAGIDWTLGIGP